jgi:signal transduction histidine kinase/DNA-binding NarL/FixJ family response regulator
LCYFAVGVVESLAIAFAYSGRRLNIPLIDALYWVALGLWSAIWGTMLGGSTFSEALLSATIFAICGITAAASASLVLDYVRASIPNALAALRLGTDSEVPFRRIVFEHGLVLALVPLIAFLAMTSQSRVQGLSSEVEQRFKTIAGAFEYVTKVWCDEKCSELTSIARFASAPGPASLAMKRELEALVDTESGIRAVGALDSSGRIVAASVSSSSALGSLGADLSSVAAYQSAIRSGKEVFSAEIGSDGEGLLILVRPLVGGAPKKAVYSELEVGSLSRLLSGIAAGGRVSSRILDSEGRIVVSSEKGESRLAPFVLEKGFVPVSEIGNGPNRPGFYLEEETPFGPGWKAVFTMPLEPLRASVVANGLMISLFALAVVFIILVVSILTSKLLVSSLEGLRRTADRFTENGDMSKAVTWPASRISEVASLSRSFAEAGELLYRRYQEVQASLGEAAAASYEKEKLLAAVSHDIRGPLGSIVDLSMLLGSSLEEQEKRDQARLVEDTARELLGLVEDLLDRDSIKSGRFELRSKPFDLRLLFDSVGRAYQGSARAKGVELRLDWDQSIPRRIVGDRARLFQVLGNLVGNAVKYTDRGEVVLSASSVSVLSVTENGAVRVHFAVSDTGIGIEPDQLEHVFEPYYRADDDPARSGKGLGLSIVSGVVQAMGGAIKVSSERGSGSRFEFSLEFSLPEPGTVLADDSELGCHRVRVLLADDERISRAVARRVLSGAGHEVVEAEDGRAAVDAALGAAPGAGFDLILLDLGMPVLDGRSAAREIRSRFATEKPCARIPRIVALTASMPKELGSFAAGDGFDGYIEKPACPDSLIAAARDAAAAVFFERPTGGSPATATAVTKSEPEKRLIDYEGLFTAYGGSEDFVRKILSVFIADGSKYVAKIRGLVDGSDGALGENWPSLMSALHSLVNVMGAGMAQGALSAARASERFLLDFADLSVPTIASSGLERALLEAEAAIAEARTYLSVPRGLLSEPR